MMENACGKTPNPKRQLWSVNMMSEYEIMDHTSLWKARPADVKHAGVAQRCLE